MSKVVHLSEEAHQKAKEYCRRHGLKMSEWVAALIGQSLQKLPLDIAVSKKPMTAFKKEETLESIYAAPPFWAKAQ